MYRRQQEARSKIKFWNRSLSSNMLLGQAAVVIVAALVLIVATYSVQSRETYQRYELKADEYFAYLQQSAALPMWNLNMAGIRKICEAFTQNEDISRLEIKDEWGTLLYSYHSGDDSPPIERSGNIQHQAKTVGHIYLGMATSNIHRQLNHIAASNVLTMLVILLALIAATGIMVRIILNRPLNQLLKGIHQASMGDYDHRFSPAPQKELAAIITEFESMAALIQAREQRLTREAEARRKAEAALRRAFEKGERLERIVNQSPAVAFSREAAEGWPVEFVSDNIRQFGYTPEDFSAGRMRYVDMVHPDDIERVAEEVRQHSQDGQKEQFTQQYRIITRNDRMVWTEDRTWIIRDPKGRITHYQGVVLDITDRKLADKALEESENKFRHLFNNASDAIFLMPVNADNRVESFSEVNEVACQRYGYSRDELLKMHPEKINGGAQTFEMETFIEKLVQKKRMFFEMKTKTRDETIIPVEISATAFEMDQRLSILAIVRDITARKQAEKELRKHRDHLEELIKERTVELTIAKEHAESASQAFRHQRDMMHVLVETLPAPIYYKDLNGHYTGCNVALAKIYGKQRNEIIGKSAYDLLPREMADPIHKKDREILEKGGNQHYEWKVKASDGRIRDMIFDKAALRDKNGAITGLIGIMTDITDMMDAQKQAEIANQAKSEFLANMSHEIRTPLNGIIGMSELLLGTHLDATQLDYAKTVQVSANALLAIINDILDFSKIEAGKLELEIVHFDLQTHLAEVVELERLKAESKNLDLRFHIAPEIQTRLRGDPGRLRQILLNLVSNAIKFTDAGEVFIQVEPVSEQADAITLRFSVKDTGIGIPPKRQDRLFKSFSQVDSSTTRKFGGTGLGLAICHQLVELMGGEIGIQSSVGEGALFWFVVELEKQNLDDMIPDLPDLKDRRVMIVHGDEAQCNGVRAHLESNACEVVSVHNTEQALSELNPAAMETHPFDLILIGTDSAHIDATALAEEIKRRPQLENAQTVFWTAQGTTSDEPESQAIPFTKPIHELQLVEVIAKRLANHPQIENDSREALTDRQFDDATEKRRHFHILVAEDNTTNQMVALHLLNKFGYRAQAVGNGREALEAIKKVNYDLILMDIQMPEMDGMQATRAIRALSTDRCNVPIVAMTAHVIKGDREKCLEVGMNDYIPKPVEPKRLLATMEKWTDSETGDNSSVSQPPAKELGEIVDLDSALERTMGDMDFLINMLKIFLSTAPQEISALQDCIENDDTEAVVTTAHTLKGAALNLSALKVADAALKIEKHGRKKDMAAAKQELAQLNATFQELEEYVNGL